AEPLRSSWRSLARALIRWRVLPLWLTAALLIMLELRWAFWTAVSWRFEALAREAPWLSTIGVGGWVGIGLLLAFLITIPIVGRQLASARKAATEGRGSAYAESFLSFLAQPKVGLMLAFAILFRTGESFLQKMRWPFFDDVVGLPLETYGIANGTIGVLASFAATIVGGRLIA